VITPVRDNEAAVLVVLRASPTYTKQIGVRGGVR